MLRTILMEANMPDGFVRLSEQTCDSDTQWLWNDRIPFGAVTTLEGDPGTNKSTLAYYLAAGLTVGRRIYRNPQLIDGGAVLLQGEESSSKASAFSGVAWGGPGPRIRCR